MGSQSEEIHSVVEAPDWCRFRSLEEPAVINQASGIKATPSNKKIIQTEMANCRDNDTLHLMQCKRCSFL